jgi:hypothetical protein
MHRWEEARLETPEDFEVLYPLLLWMLMLSGV